MSEPLALLYLLGGVILFAGFVRLEVWLIKRHNENLRESRDR